MSVTFHSNPNLLSASLRASPRPLRSIALSLFLAVSANAQDLGVKAPPQAHAVTIYNATIHRISAPAIEKGFIVFADGVIKEIGEGNPHIPAPGIVEDQFIDAKGAHVFPGLVAVNTQLGLREFGQVRQTLDNAETGDIKPEVLAVTAVNPDSTVIPVTRSNGILTAAVFPTGGLVPGRASAIRLDAWTIEDLPIAPSLRSPSAPAEGVAESSRPGEAGANRDIALRMNSSSALGLCLNWPQARVVNAWWMDKSEDDQLKDIRAGLERVTKLFDTAAAYDAARRADPNAPIDLRWEAMRAVLPAPGGTAPGGPALRAGSSSSLSPSRGEVASASPAGEGSSPRSPSAPAEGVAESARPGEAKPHDASAQLPIFISANDLDQITAAVNFCAERSLRMILVGGRESHLCTALLKEHNIPVVLMGTHEPPARADLPYDANFTLPLQLESAGVTWCMSTGEESPHLRNLPYDAASAVAAGLPLDVALRSITLAPAQIIGLGDQLGSLEAGKRATLFIADGHTLEITTQVTHAYIDGREIDLSNKQTRLRDKYRARYMQSGDIKPDAPKAK